MGSVYYTGPERARPPSAAGITATGVGRLGSGAAAAARPLPALRRAVALEVLDRLLDLGLVLGLAGLLDHLHRNGRDRDLAEHACHERLRISVRGFLPCLDVDQPLG